MDIVADSKNDEFYTPSYAITPLLKYIKPQSEIWCPFDTEQSNFAKVLRGAGHVVNPTHLATGTDFFSEPRWQEDWIWDADYDYIISNPPYSIKGKVFERLFELGKPFAMLVGVVGLFESQKRFEMFKNNDFEIMYMNRRIAYFKSYEEQKPSLNPPFSSVYICKGILPKQIIFEEIIK